MRRVFPIARFRAPAPGLFCALIWTLSVWPIPARAADAGASDVPDPVVVPKVSAAAPEIIAVPPTESPENIKVPATPVEAPASEPKSDAPVDLQWTMPKPDRSFTPPTATPDSPPPTDENKVPQSAENWTPGKPRMAPPKTSQSGFFIVTGPDSTSVAKVMEIIGDEPDAAANTIQGQRSLMSLMAKFFTWPAADADISQIEVQLTPDAVVDFSGPFKVAHDASGHRVVFVRWNAETTFSDTCLALATAALEQLVVWHHDPATAEKIPDWLRLAMGKMLEVQLKAPLIDALVEDGSHEERALSLRQIVEAHAPFSDAFAPILAVNSYWLARYLEEQAGDGPATRQLFDALASGADPVAALQAAFAGQFSDGRELETWWRVGYFDMLEKRAPIIQNFAQTRAELDHLQEVLVRRNGQDMRVQLDDAWPDHADPDVNKAVTAMEIEAHTKWPEVNPVYNNALVSMEAVLDALRRGDDEAALHKAWKQYEADRAEGQALEDAALAALAETEPAPEEAKPAEAKK
jgi:hypothetical protein